jgi:hypothetical protein
MAILPRHIHKFWTDIASIMLSYSYTSAKSSYQYKTLPAGHIRLLVLFPGPRGTKIRCSLQPVALTDFEDRFVADSKSKFAMYEALSYCWGRSEETKKIECDGQSLEIRANLERTLRYFRYEDKIRVMWVDAMCINQEDNIEKSQQVSLMGVIYWKARRVVVWLGEQDEGAKHFSVEEAFALIRRCSDFTERMENDEGFDKSASMPNEMKGLQGDEEANSWEAVRHLLSREWFTRVWVVQELGLAREATFYCGDATIDFQDVDRFCDFLNFYAPLHQARYRLDLQMINLARRYQESTRGGHRLEFGSDPHLAEDFSDILASARGLQCTDARDSIYAFLGHPAAFKKQLLDSDPYMWYPRNFDENKPTIIEPDYSKTTSVMDVYFRLAFTMIEQHGLGMKLLQYIQHDEMTIQDTFPSWVPRWMMTEASPFTTAVNRYAAAAHLPCTSFEVSLGTKVEPSTLSIKAIFVGTVYWSSAFPEGRYPIHSPSSETAISQHSDATEDCHSHLENFIETLDMLQNDFPTQKHCDLLSLSATLTAGLTYNAEGTREAINEENAPQHYHDFCAYRRLKANDTSVPETLSNETTTLSSSHDDDEIKGHAEQYIKALRAEHRGCFLTRDGRLGLGPRITLSGDQIWIPMGADTPFVLRPTDDGNFRVLGQAYVHGVMHGEAVAHLSESGFEAVHLV